jgi:hypothetical protein
MLPYTKPLSAGGTDGPQAVCQSVANEGTAMRTVSRPSVKVTRVVDPETPSESNTSCWTVNR